MKLEPTNKPYPSDPSMVSSGQYHVIFCPKYRRSVLNEIVSARMKERVLEKQAEDGSVVLEMEVMPDHVHPLLDIDPRMGVNQVVAKIKGYPSHELRQEFPWLKKRLPTRWTRSTFISTVGAVTLEVVQQYLGNQKGA